MAIRSKAVSFQVGYGDAYPSSTLGKVFAMCVMMTGLLIIALPVGDPTDGSPSQTRSTHLQNKTAVDDAPDHRSASDFPP